MQRDLQVHLGEKKKKAEIQNKEQILKAAKERLITYTGTPITINCVLIRNNGGLRAMQYHIIFKMLIKTINQESYLQQSYLSKLKVK